MTLTIDVSSELDAQLEVGAAERSIEKSDYARMILEDRLLTGWTQPFWVTASGEDWLQAFDDWMESYDVTLPPLPDDAVSRENFYGERA